MKILCDYTTRIDRKSTILLNKVCFKRETAKQLEESFVQEGGLLKVMVLG